MISSTHQIRYFLFSQYFADGIRVTLEIILPVIICAQFGRMDLGLTIATGALCVSISDIPGPVEHKRNGMLYCIGFVFIMSLLTGMVNNNIYLLGLLIMLSTFFFAMFGVYGNRAAAVGTAALLIMILRITNVVSWHVTLTDSLLVAAGGVWYMLAALLFFRLTPYRAAQRSLGDCIHEMADFLRIKAELYDVNSNFESSYRKLVSQQVVVNEKQDIVRELLFRNREISKEFSNKAKLLVLTFVDSIDLYEQITATWYDYTSLRNRFGNSGILDHVSDMIKHLAEELDQAGLAIQSNRIYKKQYDYIIALDQFKASIDAFEDKTGNLLLKKILVNLRSVGEHIDTLINYFKADAAGKRSLRNRSDYAKFISHQEINPVIFLNNLALRSGIFRHALRVMITCLAGFIIAKIISYGHHSYWILLTIIIILKPGFSLTRQRNIQRITGTIAGGLIGILILHFIHDRSVLLGLIIFFMAGTYTFQRLNYIVMVIFTTPYVLVLFNLLGLGVINVAKERLLDTGIASVLAFAASYLLFPHWESKQLTTYMASLLKANIDYLEKLKAFFSGIKISSLQYKLARKELYVSSANLSAAFNRMLSEPKSKQRHADRIYEFVVLNHTLLSNIAGLSANMDESGTQAWPKEALHQLNRIISALENSLLHLDKTYQPNSSEKKENISPANFPLTDKQLTDQLDFIYKLTVDIEKVSQVIT